MLKLPVITRGITLQEIPGEVAVFFEIGNCKQKCKGCHSPFLQAPIAKVYWTDIEELVRYAELEKSRGATAIVLMGGTTNGLTPDEVGTVIKRLSVILPVGIFSGAGVTSVFTRFLQGIPELTWLKAGEYRENLGGLASSTTNQRFYKRSGKGWEDITSSFHLS